MEVREFVRERSTEGGRPYPRQIQRVQRCKAERSSGGKMEAERQHSWGQTRLECQTKSDPLARRGGTNGVRPYDEATAS